MKLPKSARLHHRSLQERLFSSGTKMYEYPMKLIWNPLTVEELQGNFRDKIPDLIGPVQILVSVPKKKRRRAVDRVLMRRRIREAFRINRGMLLDALDSIPGIRTLSVGIVYMKEDNMAFGELEEKLKKLLERLIASLKEKYPANEEDIVKDPDITD